METVTGSFVASGRNPDIEIQQLQLVYSNTSITVSGTTASTTMLTRRALKASKQLGRLRVRNLIQEVLYLIQHSEKANQLTRHAFVPKSLVLN